jgi:hypothetical protein
MINVSTFAGCFAFRPRSAAAALLQQLRAVATELAQVATRARHRGRKAIRFLPLFAYGDEVKR